jgi:DNA repair exonuclease SbcCD ATPase subunit
MDLDSTSMSFSDSPVHSPVHSPESVTSVSTKATPKAKKCPTRKRKSRSKPSESITSSKRWRRSSSTSPALPSSPPKDETPKPQSADEIQLSTATHEPDLQSAIATLQNHLTNLHTLRTQNAQLEQETVQLKQQVDDKDSFIWELKEYNENLQERVTELQGQCDTLQDKLQKIRRLSGVDV